MIANRPFAVDNLLTFLVFGPWLAVFFFGSMYFQVAVGQEPTQAGFSILTMFYSFFVAARIGGGWMDKFGAKKPVSIGFLLGTIGMVVWAGELSELSHSETLIGMLLTGAGFGLVFSPLNTDALNRLPDAMRGQGSGIIQTFRNFGSALGMAIMGTHRRRRHRPDRRRRPQATSPTRWRPPSTSAPAMLGARLHRHPHPDAGRQTGGHRVARALAAPWAAGAGSTVVQAAVRPPRACRARAPGETAHGGPRRRRGRGSR